MSLDTLYHLREAAALPPKELIAPLFDVRDEVKDIAQITAPAPYLCWARVDRAGILLINRDLPKDRLGHGTYAKKVYAATFFRISREEIKLCHAAIIKVATSSFSATPYHLLSEVPDSPYLGGRTIAQLVKEERNEYVYLIQKRLPKENLQATLSKISIRSDRLSLFLKGMLNTAQGLRLLHEKGLVHRDVRVENSTETQLYDFNALCKAGPHPINGGATFDIYPPELIKSLHEHIPSLLSQHRTFQELDPIAYENLPAAPITVTEEPQIIAPFLPSFDIYTFGKQFERFYGSPASWTEVFPLFKLKYLIISMLDFNPSHRPSISIIIEELSKHIII
ncbi:MAG: protein kinase [Simkaniaceae bacterium]|nr:protein kinase [Simkaniaceae bacterium]